MSRRTLRWLLSLAHRPVPPRAGRLTILRHHRVYADHERPLYRLGVSERVFAEQLGMLRALGLTPVTVSEGLVRLGQSASGHWVALSFDDGYADNVRRALPLLRATGARATFYLTAGLIEERRAPWWDVLAHLLECTGAATLPSAAGARGAPLALTRSADRSAALRALLPALRVPPAEQRQRLDAVAAALGVAEPAPCALATWQEARALVDAGMELGAHTLTHPFLSLLSEAQQEAEIGGSIDLIERRAGVRPRSLAYPAGDYDGRTLEVAQRLGFDSAATTRAGDNGASVPRLELRRRGLSEGACLGPGGRFSRRLARAELDGAFDALRGTRAEVAT